MEGRALPMVFSPSTCPDQRRGLPHSTCHRAPHYGFVGVWWRAAEIMNDDDASSPNRLNQRPEKKERRAWEIFNAEKFFGSAELTSRALQKAT